MPKPAKPEMKLIAAVDKNWGIGRDGKLLFYLPDDLKYFKQQTNGKTVVMGRKTLQSLPNGKPLVNRNNIVLTNDKNFYIEGATVVHSIKQLLAFLDNRNTDNVFVIGGGSVYDELAPYCTEALITEVDADGNADIFIQTIKKWKRVEASEWMENNGIKFRFCKFIP